ncbi:male sterility protein [Colletotrichum orchidophilum]|uniref:Male sterility protein n=1 Tax=Colletotrichum orchidophilum TaxID=1209926 RepID=A0A1G4BNM7_9PEZI|nr:male sterility protein [Colletotrichum orchidophilum]OHF03049.1 male sterility protein [Colletotrichum orchidophilum]
MIHPYLSSSTKITMATTTVQATGPSTPSVCGQRTFPSIIDERAAHQPNRTCFSTPRTSDPRDGWRDVTYKEFANAVNYTARFILDNYGVPAPNTFPTIAYIGPNDARYCIMTVAAIKAGYKALFVSPRNPLEAQLNLFKLSDCQLVARPPSHQSVVDFWVRHWDMRQVEIEPLHDILSKPQVPNVPYTKTAAEADWDPFLVLHTSGSTGLPKPIVLKHGSIALTDAQHLFPEWNGTIPIAKAMETLAETHFSPMPLYHAGGIYGFIGTAVLSNRTIVFPFPDRPLTPDLTIEILQATGAKSASLLPSLLEEMCLRPDHIAVLKRLNFVGFGGGPLNKEAGDILCRNGVTLLNIIGATETLPFCIYHQKNQELWQYFIYNEELSGLEFRKATSDEDVYEMIITRKSKQIPVQGIFYTFPDREEYATSDLYKPHPSLPHHWKFHGRADNIINLSNGEKLNPVKMEEIIAGNPDVKAALIVGTQKFQPALIIEPFVQPKTDEEIDDLIERVMPQVAEANETIATHGRIVRHLITVSNPAKPFLMADKGTLKRSATIKLYADEIEELYANPREVPLFKVPRLDLGSQAALSRSIEKLLREHLGVPHLESNVDFFAAGMDSLQIIAAARSITASLRATHKRYSSTTIEARDMYTHVTPHQLAGHILQSSKGKPEGDATSGDSQNLKAMDRLYQKMSKDLIHAKPGRPEPAKEQQTVILTGSTGNMGCYLLNELIHNPHIKKIICFNRSNDGGAGKQANAMKERGLAQPEKSGKVEFFHTNLSQPNMGLSQEVYSRLLKETDRIVHNAWAVNFNMPLDAFEPHIKGCRNLADFAATTDKRVFIIFVSTIGTTTNWHPNRGPVPEKSLREYAVSGLGYGQGKLISSLVLEDAAKVGDFPLAIIRVGQIAGPLADRGMWSRQEWLPSIIASSLVLKALPRHLCGMNTTSWVPVEIMSRTILDIGGLTEESRDYHEGYFHGSNPSITTFGKLIPAIQQYYGKHKLPELVSFKEWVERLEASRTAHGALGADRNPGLKLVDFYKETATVGEDIPNTRTHDTTRTAACSPALRSAGPVTPELMAHWCRQWNFESPARVGRL